MPIQRLSPLLIDQIAAGEVIERPAAAVKELVENAIDAGAHRIDVTLEQGGRRLIRVVDDGSGMSADDLLLSVERHATSKLPGGNLDAIATLGFRGEALPSIAAVARLTITSRPENGAGHALMVDAGRIGAIRPAAFGKGTRIEVEDLFHATPARLKFLKGDRAEAQATALVLRRLAMAKPDIAFTLTGEHLTALNLRAESADEAGRSRRIGAVLGADFAGNATPVRATRGDFMLEGLVSLPTFHRATAMDQYLFVNGRPVRDKLLIGALRAAYADSITSGRHPMVALFLTLDPAMVDVNVHPGKLEVRFRESEAIRSLIVGGIRDALAGAGHRTSSGGGAGLLARFSRQQVFQNAAARPLSFAFPQGLPREAAFQERGGQPVYQPASAPEPVAAQEEAPPLGYALAQLHDTYILAQTADGVVLVDQHAAHERLVYERLKAARAGAGIPRQPLLIPAVVEMDESAIERLMAHAEALESMGLGIERFGAGALLVREVPAALINADCGRLLRDLADHIGEWGGPESLDARADMVLKTFACHHSIRAGRRMKREEMDALLREMEATPGSGQCNHGRPTSIALALSDLERLFGRG